MKNPIGQANSIALIGFRDQRFEPVGFLILARQKTRVHETSRPVKTPLHLGLSTVPGTDMSVAQDLTGCLWLDCWG
jgi:hypothetical protein